MGSQIIFYDSFFRYSKRSVFAWLGSKLCFRRLQKAPDTVNSDAAEELALAERNYVRSVVEELEDLAFERIAANAMAQLEADLPETSEAIGGVAQPPMSPDTFLASVITSPPTPSAAPLTTPTAPSPFAIATADYSGSKKYTALCCFW
jgi:hypothetical protein